MRWLTFFLLTGCIENGFSSRKSNSIAVTHGDFDTLSEALDRQLVQHGTYEGLISNATWTDNDIGGVPVENLFFEGEMGLHDAVFVGSGTRGFGRTVYNANRPDDQLIGDEERLAVARNYLRANKSFLLTDWSYDLAAQAWPEYIDFLGDDTVFDAAQLGDIGTVVARVTDPVLAEALGMDQVVIDYNFSNWAVIESVSEDTRVWLRGDIRHYDPATDSYVDLLDVPLLASFEPNGGGGKVAVMTFHANAQTAPVIDTILEAVLGPLPNARDDE